MLVSSKVMRRSRSRADFRVVFVNPGWLMKRGNIGALPDLYPALGIASIAAVLREAGFPVTIVDMPIAELDDDGLVEAVAEHDPAVIGITMVTMTYPTGVRLARLLREHFPDAIVVGGGVHPTDAPDEALAEPAFDYTICGAGEIPMLTLCERLQRNDVDPDIPGVGYNLAKPPRRVPPDDFSLDDLPPTAYDLYDLDRYRDVWGHMSLLTAHGCNARCIFCTSGYRHKSVKLVPIERVRAELNLIVGEYGFKYVNIFDSNFTYRRPRVHAICAAIIEDGLRFRWRCFSKTSAVDLDLFRHMASAGCSHVLFGVETAHDKTMRLIRKGSTRALVEQSFAWAREAGLKRVAYSIVGLPGETEEDVRATIDFLVELDAEFNVVSPISLMPGTPLMEHMDEYGMVALETDWSKGSQADVTATNGLIAPDRLQELVDYAYTRLNGGADGYDWHEAVSDDPNVCPYAAMVDVLDPIRSSAVG
jgi:radical SAM superfamily enzyme YgiQ (UPF0313 family)